MRTMNTSYLAPMLLLVIGGAFLLYQVADLPMAYLQFGLAAGFLLTFVLFRIWAFAIVGIVSAMVGVLLLLNVEIPGLLDYWPVLLIAVAILLLVLQMRRR